jgi:hypothetical protein
MQRPDLTHNLFALLLTCLHGAPVERLKRADIVWIKLGERVDLFC